MWFLVLALACDEATPTTAPPSEAAPATARTEAPTGAEVFATHCASCHGAEGRGDGPAAAALTPPPADLSRPRAPEDRHPPSRYEIIREGSPGTAMQAYAAILSEAELEAVSTYIHVLAHGDGQPGHGPGQGRGKGRHGAP